MANVLILFKIFYVQVQRRFVPAEIALRLIAQMNAHWAKKDAATTQLRFAAIMTATPALNFPRQLAAMEALHALAQRLFALTGTAPSASQIQTATTHLLLSAT